MLQESKNLGDGSHLLKKVYISSHNKKKAWAIRYFRQNKHYKRKKLWYYKKQ